ncbi:O-methyltransferase-domain-containing protein [Tricharina praecox]|uniref:O-methyltransferase-domain-containing protein n=1 Tax=Tricharina praecox TaxID=43433 RepID=UPI00221E9B91|nr:O-methyltransferase-domain-containing protein [Tricharina praecox]KAI5857804.1 O-methyltransferase-domain-containing protein [Tricharina praecox]
MATSTPPPSILQLATDILAHAKTIHQHLESNGIPQPGFDRDSPLHFPSDAEIQGSRMALIEAAKAIYDLAVGPTNGITWSSLTSKFETVVLRAITTYNLAEAVPLHGEASFAQIAAASNLHEDFVTRIIRYATTSHIFKESRPGWVIHTAASRAILEDHLLRSFLAINADEGLSAAAKINEANDKYGHTGSRYETAFCVANGLEGEDMFGFMERPDQQWRKKRFAECMQYRAKNEESTSAVNKECDPLLNGSFDWDAIGEGLVVDIGGGLGHICASIARNHPKPRFLVQDLASVVSQGKTSIESEEESVKSRISFIESDFWSPQTVEADVYFMRLVMHDWSDEGCAKILKNIIPKMKPNSRIVIVDAILAEANTIPKLFEKLQRTLDLSMMMLVGGKERTGQDWELLMRKADPRLRIVKMSLPPGSQFGLIEVALDRRSAPFLSGKL